MKRLMLVVNILIVATMLFSAFATPTPEVIEKEVTKLVEKHFEGRMPAPGESEALEETLKTAALRAAEGVEREIGDFHPNGAIREAMELSREVNRYLEQRAPWKSIKEDREATGRTLYHAAEALRIVGVLLQPVMPEKCGELLSRLGRPALPVDFAKSARWGLLEEGAEIHSGDPLFPRFEIETGD